MTLPWNNYYVHIKKYLSKHYSKYLSQAKDGLIIKWKELDNKLYEKKPKDLVGKDHRPKTIWTPYTDLFTFTRRRYFDKKKKTYRYLLDKYKFISKHYQKLVIFNFEKFMDYKYITK